MVRARHPKPSCPLGPISYLGPLEGAYSTLALDLSDKLNNKIRSYEIDIKGLQRPERPVGHHCGVFKSARLSSGCVGPKTFEGYSLLRRNVGAGAFDTAREIRQALEIVARLHG